MKIVPIEGFKQFLGLSLIKIREKEDISNLVNEILLDYKDPTIQFVNPQAIAGLSHIYHAVRHSLRALKKNRLVSKNLSFELLLYLAARRQINESLKFLGITKNIKNVIILAVSTSKIKIEKSLGKLAKKLGDELPITLIGKDSVANYEYISCAYSITDKEINSTYLNPRENFNSKLEKLVVERLALSLI